MATLDDRDDLYIEYRKDRSGMRAGNGFYPFLKEGERPPSGGGLVCIPWEDRKIPDSIQSECITCGRKVSVPPQFQHLTDVRHICIYCVIEAEMIMSEDE